MGRGGLLLYDMNGKRQELVGGGVGKRMDGCPKDGGVEIDLVLEEE